MPEREPLAAVAPDDAPALRWRQVKCLLSEALDLPAAERAAFVDRVCAADAALRGELQTLLAAADQTRSPLDQGPADLALQALEARSAQAWTGRRLGAYQLQAVLGAGGMGLVFRAERADGQYQQQVALKLMLAGLNRGAAVERFLAERQILATLDHPNLARLLDGGVSDEGVPYFVMELVDGEPIDRYADRCALGLDERLRLFRSVCQVVHYAHQQQVVHRDLKPANILVTQGGVVKLVDFGIAKRLAQPTPQTLTAARVMTLQYASPEQVRGDAVTPASDIYALGVVLYRLLTGAGPYGGAEGDSDYDLSRAICDTVPPPPSRCPALLMRGPGVRDLDAMVLMALRKEPERRYGNAAQLADDVFRYLERLPVQARRGAWGYRAGRFMLRHRAAMGAALVANIVLLGAFGLAAWQAWEATRQRERAQHHLAAVRKLAGTFIFDVHDAIQVLPGSTDARRMLADTGRQYLEQLSAETAGGDSAAPGLRRQLAVGYRKLGDVQARSGVASLGDVDAALASHARAIELLRPLASPGGRAFDMEAANELAVAHHRRGALLASRGEAEAGLQHFNAADAVADLMVAHEPVGAVASEGQRRRAANRVSIAQVHLNAGRFDAYDVEARRAVQMYTTLAAQRPTEPELVRRLASLHGMRADFLLRRDASEASARQALDGYRTALAVLQPVHRGDGRDGGPGGNAIVMRDLALHHNGIGEALTRLHRPVEALPEHRQAAALIETLLERDPASVPYRAELASVKASTADAQRLLGETAGAVLMAEAAVGLYDALPPGQKATLVTRYRRAHAHRILGQALRARGNRVAACAQLGRSLALLEEMESLRAGLAGGNLTPAGLRVELAACKGTGRGTAPARLLSPSRRTGT